MNTMAIVLASIDILLCAVLIFLVVLQESNTGGMGVITGGSDTFFSKEKDRSSEQRLKRFTKLVAVLFGVVTLVLYLLLEKGL